MSENLAADGQYFVRTSDVLFDLSKFTSHRPFLMMDIIANFPD